jgi:hypothetical protein
MYFMLRADLGPGQVHADVAYVDAEGRLRLEISGLESTSSAQLNRICGWAGEIRA